MRRTQEDATSEQRIEHGAERATSADADRGGGQGLQAAGSHGTGRTTGDTTGETEETASGAQERSPEVQSDDAQTEGARHLQATQQRADTD